MAISTGKNKPGIATSKQQLRDDFLQQEAARTLIGQGAAGRTSAAEDAVERFRGLEQSGMTRAVSGIMADLDAGVYDSEEQALMAIAGLAASESDPEIQEYINSLIRGMTLSDAVSRQRQEMALQESVGGVPLYGESGPGTGNLT